MTTVVVVAAVAVLMVVAGTAYAWHDWRTRPQRYGRPPSHRHTDTRRPVKHWTARWIQR